MKVEFSKKGLTFMVEANVDTVTIAIDGVAVTTTPRFNTQHKAWGYEVSKYEDKAFFKAIGVPNNMPLFIGHDSAEEVKEYQKKLREERRQAEIETIKSGKEKIKLHYQDGEYLSGYTVFGHSAKLLEELGLCKDISGWGYRVESEVAEALGEEFTYEEAAAFAKPRIEEKERKKKEKASARQAKFDEAKRTGKPVILSRYSVDCNDPNEDCSLDVIVTYAMPDGTEKTERHHTW